MYRFRVPVFLCLTAFVMGLILQQEFALLSIMSANILKNSLQIVERLPLQFRLRSQYKSNGLASARAISSTIHSPTPRISNPLFPSSTRSFSSTKTAMTSSKSFFNAVKDRRSIYALNKESPISDEAIEELVKQTVLLNKYWKIASDVVNLRADRKSAHGITSELARGNVVGVNRYSCWCAIRRGILPFNRSLKVNGVTPYVRAALLPNSNLPALKSATASCKFCSF